MTTTIHHTRSNFRQMKEAVSMREQFAHHQRELCTRVRWPSILAALNRDIRMEIRLKNAMTILRAPRDAQTRGNPRHLLLEAKGWPPITSISCWLASTSRTHQFSIRLP